MSEREATLLEIIRVVRGYPDFDSGGPMAEMMDQALRGEEPTLLLALFSLSQGRKPAQPKDTNSKRLPADLVEEIREFLEDYSDVVDGQDGPRPNKAMALLSRIEEEGSNDIRRQGSPNE